MALDGSCKLAGQTLNGLCTLTPQLLTARHTLPPVPLCCSQHAPHRMNGVGWRQGGRRTEEPGPQVRSLASWPSPGFHP